MQLENNCWREALFLHHMAGTLPSATTESVALALLLQCPQGWAHVAAQLLELSPFGQSSGPAGSKSGRAKLSLRVMLREGPLADDQASADKEARAGVPRSSRSTFFLPRPANAATASQQHQLPLSAAWMYWPLETLGQVASTAGVSRGKNGAGDEI